MYQKIVINVHTAFNIILKDCVNFRHYQGFTMLLWSCESLP